MNSLFFCLLRTAYCLPPRMTRATRRSGLVLMLLGLLGAVFFVLTDPRLGPAGRARAAGALDWRHWLFVMRGSPDSPVDAAHEATLGTLIGLVGAAAMLLIGLWLLTRRRV